MSSDETETGSAGDDTRKPDSSENEQEERERTFARRALLQSGWAVPVVLALGMPRDAYAVAQSPHDDHSDEGGPHGDDNGPHGDVVHDDAAHNDHTDTHADFHVDQHGDGGQHGDAHADDPGGHVDHNDSGGFADGHTDRHDDHTDHTDVA